jgi:hypothetical protein
MKFLLRNPSKCKMFFNYSKKYISTGGQQTRPISQSQTVMLYLANSVLDINVDTLNRMNMRFSIILAHPPDGIFSH